MAISGSGSPLRQSNSVQTLPLPLPHTPKLTHSSSQLRVVQNSPSIKSTKSPSITSRKSSRQSSPRHSTTDGNNIRVIARIRPQNDFEKNLQQGPVLNYIDERSTSVKNEVFTFDRVFNAESTQKDVFAYSVAQTVDELFNGYNGAVLAYGQTGSGKTYTMMGSDISNADQKGLIPRITDSIFEKIQSSDEDTEYTLSVSYMEIYMEQIRDLLIDPKNSPSVMNLQVREDEVNGIHVKNLTKSYIGSAQELYGILEKGSNVRAKASTEMNEESSRSHAIIQINLNQENPRDGIKRSKLFLVDLAGSEKVGKTGVSGQNLEEAKKINSSLSALGNVINALTDSRTTHVPYRDSKLTRILQESLGGNSRTSLIINCSPSSFNEAETLSTLRFGTRAKKIKNKAHINAEPSKQDLIHQIESLKRINEEQSLKNTELECELELWKNGSTKLESAPIEKTLPSLPTPISPVEEKTVKSLESQINQLKDLVSKTPTIVDSTEISEGSLFRQYQESQEVNKALMLDLTEKCSKLVEMELKIDDLEDQLKKSAPTSDKEYERIFTLETTLEQFSINMQELTVQNDMLRKDLITTRKIADTRNERIKTLESMLKDHQNQNAKENAKFENKFSILKARISNVRNQSANTAGASSISASNPFNGNYYSNSDHGVFRISEDDDKDVFDSHPQMNDQLSATTTNSTNYSSRRSSNAHSNNSGKSNHIANPAAGNYNSGKVGFNLNIMKPMKGGSTVINQS